MKIQDLVGLFDSEFGDEAAEELWHRVRHGLDDALKRIRRPQAALGVVKSPLGKLLVATSGHGIVLNYYIQSGSDLSTTITKLRMKFDPIEDLAAVKEVGDEIRGYVGGDAKALHHNADLTLAASDFQIGVLRKLQEIPRGAVISYQALGAAVGVPTGARAVGNALHDNPVPIYVPCHRVISSDRSLGGYAGGTSSKLRLLRSEGFDVDQVGAWIHDVVWGHKASRIYCQRDCRAAARVHPAHFLFFAAPRRARRAGMRPCKLCRPS